MVENQLKLVLLGGTGFVGKAILRRLRCMQAGSVEVRALVRGSKNRITDSFVQVFEGDLCHIPPALFPQESHVVIHFATKNTDIDGSGFSINGIGTQRLINLLPSSTLGVIYGSSLSVLGQGVKVGVNENQTICPGTELARYRQASEEIILNYMKAWGKEAVVFRPRFIFGVEDKYTLPPLIKLVKHGISIGDGSQAFSVIDVDDYAEIILQAVCNIYKRAKTEQRLCVPLHVGYSRPIRFCEIQDIIRQVFGLAQPKWTIPVNSFVLGLVRALPFRKTQEVATMLELIGQSQYASINNLRDELGADLVKKNPCDVLTRIITLYKYRYGQEV